MLSFQRLDVYRRAIEFLALATEIVEDLPRGHAERADQLLRAAESVVRNIAEGAGRWTRADSAKRRTPTSTPTSTRKREVFRAWVTGIG